MLKNANLKIVPYCVMKNPSEPSLIGSAISYMLLGPMSFSKIHPSIQILKAMNSSEIIMDENAIIVDDELEMNSANKRIVTGPDASIPILTGAIAPPYSALYLLRIKSAQKSLPVE